MKTLFRLRGQKLHEGQRSRSRTTPLPKQEKEEKVIVVVVDDDDDNNDKKICVDNKVHITGAHFI